MCQQHCPSIAGRVTNYICQWDADVPMIMALVQDPAQLQREIAKSSQFIALAVQKEKQAQLHNSMCPATSQQTPPQQFKQVAITPIHAALPGQILAHSSEQVVLLPNGEAVFASQYEMAMQQLYQQQQQVQIQAAQLSNSNEIVVLPTPEVFDVFLTVPAKFSESSSKNETQCKRYD